MTVITWEVPKMVYEISSNQAMRAFIVVVFSLTAVSQVLMGHEVPDFIIGVLGAFIGWYFADRTHPKPVDTEQVTPTSRDFAESIFYGYAVSLRINSVTIKLTFVKRNSRNVGSSCSLLLAMLWQVEQQPPRRI